VSSKKVRIGFIDLKIWIMKYDDYLLKVLKDECPFCDIKKEYILEK
jgi:hypothetical protein